MLFIFIVYASVNPHFEKHQNVSCVSNLIMDVPHLGLHCQLCLELVLMVYASVNLLGFWRYTILQLALCRLCAGLRQPANNVDPHQNYMYLYTSIYYFTVSSLVVKGR